MPTSPGLVAILAYDGLCTFEFGIAVEVFGLTYDFFHELGKADGDLEPGEEPQPLGDDGLLYYHRFRDAGSGLDTAPWPESLGTETVAAAMAEAEARVPGIVWDPPAARR